MKKKIFYLLLLCLMVLGRGEVWAETYTLSKATLTSVSEGTATFNGTDSDDATLKGGGLTIYGSGRDYQVVSGTKLIKYSAGYTYTISLPESKSGERIVSVKFEGCANAADKTSYMSNFNGTSYTAETSPVTFPTNSSSTSYTFSGDAITSTNQATFIVASTQTGLIITVTTEEKTIDNIYSGTYPYTWDFTVERDKWTKSISQVTSDNNWIVKSDGTEARCSNTGASAANGIDIIKGLAFSELTAATANSGTDFGKGTLCLDWTNRQLWMNGKITIPNLAVGQTITFDSNDDVTGDAKVNNTTGKTFTVVTAGDATFTINTYVRSIAVTKTNINFGSLGGTTTAGIPNNKTVGLVTDADWNYMFTFRDVADASTIYPMSNDEWNNVTFTPANNDVITIVSKGGLDGSGRGSIKIHPVAAGTVDVNISFPGSDRYNAKTGTVTFTIHKNTQTLTFATPTSATVNYVDYYDKTGDARYRNEVTSSVPEHAGTITYTSSDNDVATVDAATGYVNVLNSGTTTITATASGDASYNSATARYTLTVNGSHTPTLKWTATGNGATYAVADLPYGNSKDYTATIDNNDGSSVSESDIRYGVVEEYNGYLTVEATTGKITPTRKFADENLTEKTVRVYAYSIASGDRNPSARIYYDVKIVKGSFSNELFKQTGLTVNVGCTIAPRNNLQSMRWDDLDDVTVTIKSGSAGIAGDGVTTITSFKDLKYFDTKIGDKGDDKDKTIIQWFYPVFKGTSVGDVTFTVTLKSKLYGDKSGDFTLHVINEEETTGFAWADGVKNKYTLYEGDYMLMPEISGFTNGNFDYSDGAVNYNTQHKYLYSRRWNSSTSKYEMVFNNANFHKGEGMPNFDLTSDSEGLTIVTTASVDGDNVALIFWNTGSGNDNDRLLIYGNKPGTVYLKASDPQITTRALSTIEIEVKSRSTINTDFDNVKGSMTFPYTWDFTTNYDWSSVIETGNGYWSLNGSAYDLDMQSNFNYDYADFDKNGLTWGSGKAGTNTSGSEIMAKPLVASITTDKVLRGFAGMQIKLGNNGTGSWYSKRDGIHIKPYSAGEPRLHINGGQHTFVLPTPTGEDCPSTFKVFVKARALEAGKGTLWVKAEGKNPQNGYYNFSGVELNQDIIYSVDAAKGQTLTLDVEKVDIYWIAFSTEAKPIYQPTSTTYPASTYSYTKALDLDKSAEVNTGLTTYYASGFNSSTNSVTMTSLTGRVEANSGLMLRLPETDDTDDDTPSSSCYMIADPENAESYAEPTKWAEATNYLIATGNTSTTPKRFYPENTHDNTNFILTNTYHKILDNTESDEVTSISDAITDDWKYVRTAGDIEVGANKAYLQLPGRLLNINASARAMSESSADSRTVLNIVFDDEQNTTCVKSLNTASKAISNDDGWHTLQGMKVSTPTKGGLYIYNGKKIAVK